MILKSISLQNFRSYTKSSFDLNEGTTLIVGPNTSGKTNLVEAIYFIATGESFRAEKESETIAFDKEIARIIAIVQHENVETKLELILTKGLVGGKEAPLKKYLVNGISRRRVDFAGNLVCVLFSPMDLEIIIGSPFLRRRFLNEVLEQVDREYRIALINFTKALRQRNALLEKARDEGRRNEGHFSYWDNLLIEHGQALTEKREAFIDFLNSGEKDIFDCAVSYDKSTISKERLLQYKEAEVATGVTLVGPHRDNFAVTMSDKDAKLFGSRGQQRLIVLQLKLLTLSFVEKALGKRPILLLDDIFSELDSRHIDHILGLLDMQQTILTTTHQEFIDAKLLRKMDVIELR